MKHKLMRRLIVMATVAATCCVVASGAASADTFSVRNTENSGSGSLRAAITAANAEPGKDVITFAPGAQGAINLKSRLPVLRGMLEIRGPGAGGLTVRRAAAQEFRVLSAADNSTVTISGLTVSNGLGGNNDTLYGFGGGIANPGTGRMTLRSVTVSKNRDVGVYSAPGGQLKIFNSAFVENLGGPAGGCCGGGIYNRGDLTIEGSTFARNNANLSAGGGVANLGGVVTVRNSTFAGNIASGGGAIYNSSGSSSLTVLGSTFSGNQGTDGGGAISSSNSTATVLNSTFYGNDTEYDGGAIANSAATIKVGNSTFYENSAARDGGGISNLRGTFSLQSSIVAGNEAPEAPDASGDFVSGGYNLIGDTSGSTGFGPTDQQNTRSGLDPRGPRDNGGPTKTIALVTGSPAIDAILREACPPPAVDQRGISRPQDGDGDGAPRCDTGAYERENSP